MLWMQGFGNLAVELRGQFGWSKTMFSAAFSGTRTGNALLGPSVGVAISRFGTKNVIRAGSVLILLGFFGLSLVQTQFHFFLAMTVAAVGVTFAGFIAMTAALVQWFERKRAQALSLQTMGFAVGGFAGPILVVAFGWFGWRASIAGAGVVLFVAGWVASGVIGMDRSESSEPTDGIEPNEKAGTTKKAEGVNEVHYTLHDALRTRSFWMISFGHGSALIVVSAVIAHIALYLTEDRGFSAQRAALIAGAIPLFQVIGTALGGYLGDRINKRLIVVVAMCMHAAGLLLITWVDSAIAIGAFVMLHGLAWGARGPLMQAIRADYFGSTNFAGIMGWSSIIVMFGTVTGPLVAGLFADATGDYTYGFTIIAYLAIAGNIFWAFATPPPPLDDTPRLRAGRQLEQASAEDMTRFAAALASMEPERGSMTYPLRGGHVILTGSGMFVNRAMAVGYEEPLTANDLAELEARSAEVGVAPSVDVCEFTHPDVEPLLLANGYVPDGQTAGLVLDPTTDRPRPPAPTSVKAVVVETDADLQRWQDATAIGWGHADTDRRSASDAFAAAAHATQTPGLLLAVGDDRAPGNRVANGVVVGCSALSIRDGVAILGGMSTLPEHRGNGVQQAMIGQRLAMARLAECSLAGTQAELDSGSMRNLVRAGFVHSHTITTFTKKTNSDV